MLPSAQELDAAAAAPAAVDALREEFLADPRLQDQLVHLLNEQWRTRIDEFDIRYYDYHLDEQEDYAFVRAVGEEPLRLIAHVAATGRPFSEIVTADYTLADELLASIWPLDREPGAGWRVARWTDGRPAAGVLVSNGLWWRYSTNTFNQSRARAGAIFRLLACEDLLTRPVSFSSTPSLLDEDGTQEAIRNEPYCLACHAAIEPLAATLFGFMPVEQNSVVEMTYYHPEREPTGPEELGVEPAWSGAPVNGLEDLGRHIAADSRFARCAARTWTEALMRRPMDPVADYGAVEAYREVLVDAGMRVPPLLRALTDSDVYRAAAPADPTDPAAAAEITRRLMRPDQLASAIEDLTGFRWWYEGRDLLDDDRWGFRVLTNGVDGVNVTRPGDDPVLTWALVVKRASELAASYAVERDLGGASPRLLTLVDADSAPGDGDFEAQLAALHWRLYAAPADDAWVADVSALWSSVEASLGAGPAWTAALSALLRDPAFVSY